MLKKEIDPSILKRAQEWLKSPFDAETKAEVRRLIEEDPKALSDAFFKNLSFGTGGMRGIMGVGTNRMNIYTIRKATQGLARYVLKHGGKKPSAFIGYDVRHNSRKFAEEAACVLAGNGIPVFLTKDVCPTPLVSFGCRKYGCTTAIVITASHNPPKYNGYKVYWSDGAQVVHPHDIAIMKEVEAVDQEIPLSPIDSPLIRSVGPELDDAYLRPLKEMQLYPELKKSDLRIVYTPLHGTGLRILPKALEDWGYENVHLVKEQSTMDGAFPFAQSPNPEDFKSLVLGAKLLEKEKGDLLIATDPDADRLGAMERGETPFSGNQIACLLLEHICSALKKKGKFPPNAAFVKSIVTTELFKTIAEDFGGACVDVLTGFKYIGEKIKTWESSPDGLNYLFGAEESYGYLFGTFVRDKDAISSACILAEAAALAKKEGLTLNDRLEKIYRKYGVHRELLVNIAFSDSEDGMRQMKDLMERLRKNPPKQVYRKKVMKVEDFLAGLQTLPPSDVLRLWLEDKTKLVVRPSGTEPKIKLYLEGVERAGADLKAQIKALDERLGSLSLSFQNEYLKTP